MPFFPRFATKGSRKNNFTESALGFRLGPVDFEEQKAQYNSGLFQGIGSLESAENDLKMRYRNVTLFLSKP